MPTLKSLQYQTAAGVGVRRQVSVEPYASALNGLIDTLDSQRGVLLASSYEYPGRYTRWDIGFCNPPLVIEAQDRSVSIQALNRRGEILLPEIHQALAGIAGVVDLQADPQQLRCQVPAAGEPASEELRSRQPTVFTVLRAILAHFQAAEDTYLGLYGAFGYDLAFQFEDIQRHLPRHPDHRDLVLYLPDEILVADHRTELAHRLRYDFICRSWASAERRETTGGFRRHGAVTPFAAAPAPDRDGDHEPGAYASVVERARQEFQAGNLFEVVPGQVLYDTCNDPPSTVFRRLRAANPAPYGALLNLGAGEYLVAASPEMFVRVEGRRIETCPISGTIRRGRNALEDAEQVRTLLNSVKDEAELSMCTDVDRNDKARVCEPGSVHVVGRRQIELYSRLIHTVDHVTGTLAHPYDGLDGFLTHTWAVTVTGAPKHRAMQFIEDHERSPRHWYGGAMGLLGFNGAVNTGLTLRTVRIIDGIAEIRVGATLLLDSDPVAEEAETRLKAAALRDAVRGTSGTRMEASALRPVRSTAELATPLQVLMIDHQDSFVHCLAGYFRQCGAAVVTLRPAAARQRLAQADNGGFDLVVLSPGPGRPGDFQLDLTLALCEAAGVPVFGVCLGLQGMVEFVGGSLGRLAEPLHGKATAIHHQGETLFAGVPTPFQAGRYHSLYATTVPAPLQVCARDADGVVMAVTHRQLPWLAVQFHPESLLSLGEQVGPQIIVNVVEYAANCRQPRVATRRING